MFIYSLFSVLVDKTVGEKLHLREELKWKVINLMHYLFYSKNSVFLFRVRLLVMFCLFFMINVIYIRSQSKVSSYTIFKKKNILNKLMYYWSMFYKKILF